MDYPKGHQRESEGHQQVFLQDKKHVLSGLSK